MLVAIMLPMIMAFVAFSVDMGNVYRVRTQDQAAVDSAALAGAAMLDGTDDGLPAAIAEAKTYGNSHYAYTSNLSLADDNVTLGHWYVDSKTFTPMPNNGSMTAFDVNAVKVEYALPTVSTPFASIVGPSSLAVKTSAIALGGGQGTEACVFPLGIADCAIEPGVVDGSCDVCGKMQSANDDNVGWLTSLTDANGKGGKAINTAVLAACFDEGGNPVVDSNGRCAGSQNGCGTTNIGDEEPVHNGNSFNNNNYCDLITQILQRNGSVDAFTVTAVVFDSEGLSAEDCGDLQMSASGVKVAGFVDVDIFGIDCGNGKKSEMIMDSDYWSSENSECNTPSGKLIMVSVHRDPDTGKCDVTPKNSYSSGLNNGTPARPRLVQ